ncbi:septal ring factor EnvC (AmiA/AmiB activator) [Catenuloplanes nepalensis]|uniref:Septal ring factor EnvC (AmiA/AmiB activator) n=1 Tax=Catenuloplanes nepalensis TaxID=587533 RepID=A0ABT9MYC6_9ACTN|nr:hypothetical protein [Catenuloplanes nepalensis]MDP9796430.1 septal ring factor EnvC (AmiA/AmiB activator) [Catenuloplanes nepalensis]
MTPLGRRCAAAVAAATTAVALLTAPLSPASAEPNNPDAGGNATLGDVLESTGKRYLEAKAVLDASKKKQAEITKQLKKAEADLGELTKQVGDMASQQYRQGRLTGPSLMLGSADPTGFVQRMTSLNELAAHNDAKLHEYIEARDAIDRSKAELDAEVAEEQKALAAIDKQKKEAEKALTLVGGNVTTNGLVTATSPQAAPGPGANSGWPAESCTQDDPTTSGCLTPRTLHAYNEVKKAGFNRFVGCFRTGDIWEHPKGRACDWSLQNSGFSVWDTDDELKYGNDLMAFLVRNADRLGILYVIWNRMVWFPATGWSSYSGDSTHEDHVHMSIV